MKYWVGVTDPGWFRFHQQHGSTEVNFWQPSARAPFGRLPEGTPFLFKLKAPYNAIAGGGTWVSTSTLPADVAWQVFGPGNGAPTLAAFRDLIDPKRRWRQGPHEHVCQLLVDVQIWPEALWLRAPPGFATNLVQGRTYDTADADGAAIWAHAAPLLAAHRPAAPLLVAQASAERFGAPQLVKPRLGQRGFQFRLYEAYERRCALTGESTLPTLDAAHIVPYSEADSSHDVSNGLLLRSDFHRLFDAGLVTVEPDLTIRVSPQIREAWYNGKAYYRLDGTPMRAPSRPEWRPDPDRLRWHNREKFVR